MCGAGGDGRHRFCGRWKCERGRVIVGLCRGSRASIGIYDTSVLWFLDLGMVVPYGAMSYPRNSENWCPVQGYRSCTGRVATLTLCTSLDQWCIEAMLLGHPLDQDG